MKHSILSLITLILCSVSTKAQSFCNIYGGTNFENSSCIDNINSNPYNKLNNTWQIGTPQKANFNGAYSGNKVIITNTSNPYPINDTAGFVVKFTAIGYPAVLPDYYFFSGYYKVDSDTLSDFGYIEFSPNNGTTWINLNSPGTYSSSVLSQFNCNFTGNVNQWTTFGCVMVIDHNQFNVQWKDTVIFRLSFISDGNQTNRSGLMFDDLNWSHYTTGIHEYELTNNFQLYPVPANNQINLKQVRPFLFGESLTFSIYNNLGSLLKTENVIIGDKELSIDTHSLPSGVYNLGIKTKEGLTVYKRFLVAR